MDLVKDDKSAKPFKDERWLFETGEVTMVLDIEERGPAGCFSREGAREARLPHLPGANQGNHWKLTKEFLDGGEGKGG